MAPHYFAPGQMFKKSYNPESVIIIVDVTDKIIKYRKSGQKKLMRNRVDILAYYVESNMWIRTFDHVEPTKVIISQTDEEYIKDSNLLLEGSIIIQASKNRLKEAKAEINQLKDKNDQLETVLEIVKDDLLEVLEMKAAIFKSDAGRWSAEEMAKYITLARYMGGKYGVSTIADHVELHMRSLPAR